MTEPTHALILDGEELLLRRAADDDRPRVTRDWIMSYRDRAGCDWDTYVRGERAVVERRWGLVHVAYRTGSEIHGWICGEPGLLHYVYVPAELRRKGLARAMVHAVCGEHGRCSHRRPGWFLRGWPFDPYVT